MLNEQQIPVLSADQMHAVDDLAITNGLSILQLMEHAALQMARHIQMRFPQAKTILVLAGTGHNGGDGIACARFLKNWGYEVVILLSHPQEKLKPASLHHLELAKKMHIEIHESSDASSASLFSDADILIDALLGYALKENPREPIATLIRQANASYKPVVSCDLPSGLDATSGKPFEPCIQADETVTLALPKAGLFEPSAKEFIGELYLADLGIPDFIYMHAEIDLKIPLFKDNSLLKLA